MAELESTASGFDWWEGVFAATTQPIKCRLTFERLADGDNGAIWTEAQASIQVGEANPRKLLPPTRINLMNATRGGGWKSLVQALVDASDAIAWDGVVAVAVAASIEQYRNGEREVELTRELDRTGNPFLLEPFVAASGVSVFFGEGGTGKSMLALAMAVVVASGNPIFGHVPHQVGPVTYFDYEDDDEVHAERLYAILEGTGTTLKHPIYHRSLIAKVSQSQASMRRSIIDTESVLAVLDSIGMGRGGNANTSEDTVRMFRALRSLEVPTLAIDHVNKEDKRNKGLASPYGSVYTINSARLLWGAVEAGTLSTADQKFLNLTNTKVNRMALHPDMGLKLTYNNKEDTSNRSRWLESIRIEAYDKWWDVQVPDTWDLVVQHLEANPGSGWTIAEIALAIDMEKAAVEKCLQRNGELLDRDKVGHAYTYRLASHGMSNVSELKPQ